MTVEQIDILSPDTVESLRAHADELRRENTKLALECVRLRDTLHTALERLWAEGDEADRVWAAEMKARWLK